MATTGGKTMCYSNSNFSIFQAETLLDKIPFKITILFKNVFLHAHSLKQRCQSPGGAGVPLVWGAALTLAR